MKKSLTIIVLLMSINLEALFSQQKQEIIQRNIFYENNVPIRIQNESFRYSKKWDIYNSFNSRFLKNETKLDNEFHLIDKFWQKWDGSYWVNYFWFNYTYDNNNLIELLRYMWIDQNWIENRKFIYSYDSNNNRIEELGERWNDDLWKNGWKYTYTYDENNNLIVDLFQNWNGTDWVNSRKNTYTYDGNNNRIDQIEQGQNDSNWVNWDKYTSIYNENNNIIGNLEYYWDDSNWVTSGREIFTYDENDNMIEFVWQIFEDSNWVNWWKWVHTYDENNNNIKTIILDPDGSSWVNTTQLTMTYDDENNMIERLAQNWVASQWVNRDREAYFFQPITGMEQLVDRVTDYKLSNNYPNPFNPTTTIQYSIPSSVMLNLFQHLSNEIPDQVRNDNVNVTLRVYDILGRVVAILVNEKQKPGIYEIEFDAKKLTSGIYLYRFQAGEFIETRKMILIK